MINLENFEIGVKEFRKGADRYTAALKFLDKARKTESRVNNKPKDQISKNDKIQIEQDYENFADFICRAIDLFLKSIAYCYIEEIPKEAYRDSPVKGHSLNARTKYIRNNIDNSKEVLEVLDQIDTYTRDQLYEVTYGINVMAYEGGAVTQYRINLYLEIANILKDFGYKVGLNNIDYFIQTHTSKE